MRLRFSKQTADGVRKLLAKLIRAIDENAEYFLNGNSDDIDLVLSKLVVTKVITPECADFILGVQYDQDHVHLMESNQQAKSLCNELTILCASLPSDRINALLLQDDDMEEGKMMLAVGDIQEFDFTAYRAGLEHIFNFLQYGPNHHARDISEHDIRVCHKEGFRRFSEAISSSWPVPFEGK